MGPSADPTALSVVPARPQELLGASLGADSGHRVSLRTQIVTADGVS